MRLIVRLACRLSGFPLSARPVRHPPQRALSAIGMAGKGISLKRIDWKLAVAGWLARSSALADTVSLANGDPLSGA